MKRYKIIISYDGTPYAGWQVQKTGLAIQPFIQRAIETIVRHPIQLTASGRTDAGVHALGQVAHFDTKKDLDPLKFLISSNSLLPQEIRIHRIEQVPLDFHARYTALLKTYHYHLHLDPIIDPFTRLYRHHVLRVCDLHSIEQALPHFLGTHDYSSFANHAHLGTASHDPIRTLSKLEIMPQKGGVYLVFESDGFLYKMVRNITGTLLDVGAGKIKPSEIPHIFSAKDRRKAGISAPPQGLFLMNVEYPSATLQY